MLKPSSSSSSSSAAAAAAASAASTPYSSAAPPLLPPPPPPPPPPNSDHGLTTKRKRRPAGTPDPDAEVVSLSPKTLLESDRYVCEICNQGFQRDQNLQMHRRRHKVPWKLLKKPHTVDAIKKKVFVCPEPTCLHHDPCHALGDLVGIKKHFRRKHSNQKHWVCDKCSKAYAVHSDFKAHLKTCGTRGHSCDCGRVFSRVESFIEHQDACNIRQMRSDQWQLMPLSLPLLQTANPLRGFPILSSNKDHDLNLHLSSPSSAFLNLSIGSNKEPNDKRQLELAIEEKAYADEARRDAKRQIEIAEVEFTNAKMIRQQAQAELEKARILKEEASRKMSSTIMEITCETCRLHFHMSSVAAAEETSLAISYMSSATTEGDGE
ncbi:protein SHOOT GRAVITROPISM 5-like [Cucurbita pepo subsp. pepo]|uniref:protein SHOOT GRAVITROPISM 5-like n=1 Tax=Cucurbita pepo subsp. pepo TaxID=3664 RepID=UPI000C9D5507|nr:protein SHOOT GRAVITROPISM 5-like [Cucurbita pepo subsp. pepo]